MTRLRSANMLGALADAIARRLEKKLKTHPNQTDSSMAALKLIGLYEGCSNGALGEALELSHPATVRLIDKLATAELVESRTGSDKRSVALFLTAKGRERVQAVLEERCVALADIVDALSAVQRAHLDDIAETLLRSFTTSPVKAAHICRLCNEIVCPADRCPVHVEALRQTPDAHRQG